MPTPLPPPKPRERLHRRTITLDGYRREDGLWDIEAVLVDTKTYGFDNQWRGRIEPGMPAHEMHFRLTVDDGYVIREVEVATTASPYEMCPSIAPNFQRLVGLQIGKGWMREVRTRLGGPQGCTHLVEMLQPLATVAFQTIAMAKARYELPDRQQDAGASARPRLLNSCHAFASDSPVVRRQWPQFYTGD